MSYSPSPITQNSKPLCGKPQFWVLGFWFWVFGFGFLVLGCFHDTGDDLYDRKYFAFQHLKF
jgi:hypothetical protein